MSYRGNGLPVKHDDTGEVEAWGGIVTARLADLADAAGTTPAAFLEAAEQAGRTPIVDTARPKNTRGDSPDRPTDPTVRCLAFTREDFQAVVASAQSGQ
jgi:hypothetical protein